MEENEQNRMLRETLELGRENNRLLRKMRRDAFLGRIFSIIFWGATLILPLVLYYFYIAPYLQALRGSIQNVENKADQFKAVEAQLPPWAQEWFRKTFTDSTSTPAK
jgi:hypothetical protein